MIRRLLVALRLIKPHQPRLQQTDVVGSATERKPNPYSLVWYRRGWSESRIAKNNARYWQWEIDHNGFKCP